LTFIKASFMKRLGSIANCCIIFWQCQ